jgi:hypothetical protein
MKEIINRCNKKCFFVIIVIIISFFLLWEFFDHINKREKINYIIDTTLCYEKKYYTDGLNTTFNILDTEEKAIKLYNTYVSIVMGEEFVVDTPYRIFLYKDSVWLITGTQPLFKRGGNVYVEISKKNGRILKFDVDL